MALRVQTEAKPWQLRAAALGRIEKIRKLFGNQVEKIFVTEARISTLVRSSTAQDHFVLAEIQRGIAIYILDDVYENMIDTPSVKCLDINTPASSA